MTDLVVTAAQVGAIWPLEANIRSRIPAVAVTAGQAVCINTSGKAALTDANALATAKFRGIVTTPGGAGQGVSVQETGEIGGFALSGLAYDAKVYLSTTPGALSDADASVNEKQTVTLTGVPTGGTFTLTYAGQETGNIAYNAAAATVQAALEALSTIGLGNVIVTGSAGGPWTVEFISELGNQNIAAMTADGALLTGGTTPDAVVAEAVAGIASVIVGRVVPMSDKDLTKVLRLAGFAG